MIVRAAMMHVLQSPSTAFYSIDVQPLSRLLLSYHDNWRVKLTSTPFEND